MSVNFLPTRDGDLALWTANFNTKITATPTTYGLTAGLATAYATANTAWQAALIIATTPATRTKVTVATKDATKADIQVLSRQYGQLVQAYPAITPTLLETLGLTVRKTTRTPIPAPVTYPLIGVLSAMGQTITLKLNDQSSPDLRALPAGVVSGEIWIGFSTTPPTSLTGLSFAGNYSKYPGRYSVDAARIGQTAYIMARWKNRRGDVGPLSAVASVVVSN